MDKKDAVLVVLNRDALEETVQKLNLDRVNVAMIITDGYDEKTFSVGGNEVPVTTFATIHDYMWRYRRLLWLIGGGNAESLRKMKKFLMAYKRIPDDNIVNIDVAPKISGTWLANVRHIDEHGADFFVTGNEYIQVGVNLKFIPAVHTDTATRRGGVVLADTNQTLQQSYLTAKHVFAHVAPGTIKFVFIGLDPQSFCRDEFRADLINDDFKNVFDTVTAEQADLNFDAVKATYNGEFSVKAINDWNDVLQTFSATAVKNNAQFLKDYIELCFANGAKPVGVVLPVARAVRKYYNAELLKSFRETIRQLEEISAFTCIDLFDLDLNYDSFFDMTHLNVLGQTYATAYLATKLHAKNLIPIESFCDMTYEYLNYLPNVAPKDEYNALMEKIFAASAEMIRRKDKIKLGFVMPGSAWCGDDLYHLFDQDERFEVTIFDYLQPPRDTDEVARKAFFDGVEQFKSHGLNVVAIDNKNAQVPNQDVLIFLTPYPSHMPKKLRPHDLTPKTLMTHITYSFAVVIRAKSFYNRILFHTAWKIFFASPVVHESYAKKSIVDMPRGFYSGYPRLDVFFKRDTQFKFDWKITRPDAKKIIYAPHWSIKGPPYVNFATFQWNYQFMFEFAKSHPEISWIVKPHPDLLISAVKEKVFPSAEAFEEYLQAWNDLPNAQVYTGAYYQDIFATSDGMIHDCGSFIAEYQYVDKPMIYLTRGSQRYNELVKQIMDVSYLVDGQDFDAIAATIQRVIIDGDDYKAAERRELFDEHLNYPKTNGMLASEFIYHSIADELKEATE